MKALHSCPYCQRQFNKSFNLKRHIKRLHPNGSISSSITGQNSDASIANESIDESIRDDETITDAASNVLSDSSVEADKPDRKYRKDDKQALKQWRKVQKDAIAMYKKLYNPPDELED